MKHLTVFKSAVAALALGVLSTANAKDLTQKQALAIPRTPHKP